MGLGRPPGRAVAAAGPGQVLRILAAGTVPQTTSMPHRCCRDDIDATSLLFAGAGPARISGIRAGYDAVQAFLALVFLGLATLGGSEPTWARALSTHWAARSASSRHALGRLR